MTAVHRSKTDLVEHALLEMIESGVLPPGTLLEQRDIARQLGVSPTPVREAFRRLETAGMIITTSHASVRVADLIDPKDPVVVRLRSTLERLFFELAVARATPEALADLQRLNAAYEAATGDERHDLHWEFHLRMFELAGSQLLVTHLRMVWNALERAERNRHPNTDSGSQHLALLDAIGTGDIDLGMKLLQRHVDPDERV